MRLPMMDDEPDACPVCQRDDVALTYGPDPFAEEIHGDDTPVWLCQDCADDSAMEGRGWGRGPV